MLDLHSHTTASDGVLTPSELVALAARNGIRTLAVTDHDTLSGVEEARRQGATAGVEVLAGVELSATREDGQSLHILGYFFDPNEPGFSETLERLTQGRSARNKLIALRLAALGMPVDLDALQAQAGGQLGRPHFARALLARGDVATEGEAFDRWLGDGRPAYIERFVLSPADAIRALHRAGGIAVIAHPLCHGRAPLQVDRLLKEMATLGADGVEVFYPDHTDGETAMVGALARRYGLLPAGGADFHAGSWPSRPRISRALLAPLEARAAHHRARAERTS